MIIAIITIVFLSIASLFGTYYLFKKTGGLTKLTALAIIAGLTLIYFALFRDSMLQIALLKSENTVIWGRWMPILAGAAIGICFGIKKSELKRIRVMLIVMLLISYIDFGENFFPRPNSVEVKTGWVVRQSSASTCSPAAVASLLGLFKVERNEKQMIEDCFTTYRGTSRQGIWRGLKKNCPDGYKVLPVKYKDKSEIEYPIIIRATLRNGAKDFDRYSNEWGWKVNVPHSVVLLKKADRDRITVGDPACGIENWNTSALDVLWDNQGFRIVKE